MSRYRNYMLSPLAGVLVSLLVLGACSNAPASRTTIDRVRAAPSMPNAPYANIVVVGITPGRNIARELEEGLTNELRAHNITAHSFVKQSPAKSPTPEAIDELVAKTGATGILLISGRLAGAKLEEHTVQGEDAEAEVIGGSLLNFFRYEYENVSRPTYTDITMDVVLVSDFYDVQSSKRIHTVDSATKHGTTSYEVIVAQSKQIIGRLKKDGVIR